MNYNKGEYMQIQEKGLKTQILEVIADELDITEEQFLRAKAHYDKLAEYLEDSFGEKLHIYPQGSFMLGTVIKPYRKGENTDYDIDLVCEFLEKSENSVLPNILKKEVGKVLKKNESYRAILDNEGKRCWTLNFSGFHMDCLPCIPFTSLHINKKISLTHTIDFENYIWKRSNPLQLGEWFRERQRAIFDKTKRKIYEEKFKACNSIDDVPDICVKTPLQRVVQILKRHRDVYFSDKANEKYKPISIIITVLAAYIYTQEEDLYTALNNIIEELSLYEEIYHSPTHKSSAKNQDLILFDGNKWKIKNPVAEEENFAEYWHEDNHARAKAFFEWIQDLKFHFLKEINSSETRRMIESLENALKRNIPKERAIKLGLLTNTQVGNEKELPPLVQISITNPIKPYRYKL